jgi:hypothetical protein
MRKFIFLISLIGLGFLIDSCSSRYVSQEPIYQTYSRPMSPGNNYIWMDGGWNWNYGTRSYIQNRGQWMTKEKGRHHKKGYWQKTKRGSRWIRGNR